MTYRGKVVLNGAKNIDNKMWMVRIRNETSSADPAAQSGMFFENVNHVTTDQWQNMREYGSNFGRVLYVEFQPESDEVI